MYVGGGKVRHFPLSTLYPYYMTLHLYPEGDGALNKNIFTGGPNIPMGNRGDVGLVGAPTPLRLVTLGNFYGLPGPPQTSTGGKYNINNLENRLVRLKTLDSFGPAPPVFISIIYINSLILGCGFNTQLIGPSSKVVGKGSMGQRPCP